MDGLSGRGDVVLKTLVEKKSMQTSTNSILESSLLFGSRIKPSASGELEEELMGTLKAEPEEDNGCSEE